MEPGLPIIVSVAVFSTCYITVNEVIKPLLASVLE